MSLFMALGARFPNYPIIHFDYFCFIQTLIYIPLLLDWLNDTNLVILMRSAVDLKLSSLVIPKLKNIGGHFPQLFSRSLLIAVSLLDVG